MPDCRPPGRLDPNPAALAYASIALAALAYPARRGAILVRYEAETLRWRFALPRAGWWRTAPRARRPRRPLTPSQSKREEALKRQAGGRYRSGSRRPRGGRLSVRGAVQYGPATVCYKSVPHCDAQERRHYSQQVRATCRTPGTEGVRGVDRRGLHRAHQLAATLEHSHSTFRFHFLPPHWGQPLNPIEGVWRVMKDAIGAGRCFANLPLFYPRTRQVLMAHHERPLYAFHG